jgi:hypothetical protein
MPRRTTDIALYDDAFKKELNDHILEAIDDLERQCACAFKKYRHALSLIAVAVAGDYWCHLSVPFSCVSPLDDDYTIVQSQWHTLVWPPPVAFGTIESDVRLAELRRKLESKVN